MASRVTVLLLIVAWLVCEAADISDMCKSEVRSLTPEARADLFDQTSAEEPTNALCEDTSIYQDCDRVVLASLCTAGPHYAHFCCRSCLDAAQVERFGPHSDPEVKAPLVTEVDREEVVVQRDEDVSLTCSASGYPMPEVAWISPDGTPIVQGTKYQITVNHEDTPLVRTVQSTLCVRNFSHDDAGSYVCLAVTPHDHTTATTNLTDPGELQLVQISQDQIVSPGEPILLECVVKAARRPRIAWKYNDISIGQSSFSLRTLQRKFPDWDHNLFTLFANTTEVDEEGLVTEYSSFRVNSSIHAHTGHYTCLARNEEGTKEWRMKVSVINDTRPFLSFTGAIGGNYQGTASVNCHVVGIPEGLTIAWSKDTEPLENSSKYTTHIAEMPTDSPSFSRTLRLDVHNLTLSDAGNYTCTVTPPAATAPIASVEATAPIESVEATAAIASVEATAPIESSTPPAATAPITSTALLHFDSNATFSWKNIRSPTDAPAPSHSC